MNAICHADAPYLAARLASQKPAGILTPHKELDASYCGVPLCVDSGGDEPMMVLGQVELRYDCTAYPSGAVAVESLGEVIGPNQAGDFIGFRGSVYFRRLIMSEYYGPGGIQQPEETPALTPMGSQPMFKAVWSRAFINDLPDSSFFYIAPGGEKDEDGKTTPRSLRKFPYKDDDGSVDLPHLRNAIARIPQSDAEGLTDEKKESLQDKARQILEKETAKEEDTEKSVDLAKVPTELLAELLKALDDQWRTGLITSEMPAAKMREHGKAIYEEMRKRAPHIKIDSPLLVETPEPAEVPVRKCRIAKVTKFDENPDYMYVLSIVMEPNDGQDGAPANPDFDDEIYDRHAIRKLAFPYVAKFRQLGLMHEGEPLSADDARMVQSYVIDDGFELTTDQGRVLKQGVWLLGTEVKRSCVVGKGIENGEIGAFSIQGLALKVPEKLAA